MRLDAAYWEYHYIHGTTGWDAGSITTPIKDYVDQLTNGDIRILIPGAGNAYEAEYLFKSGFQNVFVLDFARTPLENFRMRVTEFPTENLIQKDFFTISGQFDLIIEQTFFCSFNRNLRQRYAEKMFDLLIPGGKLAGVLFDSFRNADYPPFGGTLVEYKSYFESLFAFKIFERCRNSIKPRQGTELFMVLERNQNSKI